MILQTDRLYFREMDKNDFNSMAEILQDPVTMAAYEHAFTDVEVVEWIATQQRRYCQDGYGLWAVELRSSGEVIGQCGLTSQMLGDRAVIEIGYLFSRKQWHRGYAVEAARACKSYAFYRQDAEEVFSIIRDTNLASLNVAIRNGMLVRDRVIKHYRGMDMPHLVFSVKRGEDGIRR